jgi:GWxTD domain-containing protein
MLRALTLLLLALILPAALILPVTARAQDDTVDLALQINRYYGSQDRALIEGAVAIPYSALRFDEGEQGLRADARVEVRIERADGEEVYRTEHRIEPEAVNPEMALSPRVTSIETFAIYAPPGEYTARVLVTDLRTNQSFEVTREMVIPTERRFFSDILLTSYVQRNIQLAEATYLPYLIGTTMFNPNPRGVFFKDAPLVYFYYEMYPGEGGGEVTLEREIVGRGGELVESLGRRTITVSAGQNLDLGQFSIQELAPGGYVLRIRCTSCPEGTSVEQAFEIGAAQGALAFALADPVEETAPVAEDLKYYAGMSAAEVDSVITVLDILLSQEQKNLLATLTPEGKIRFLNRFWDSADDQPETPENEFKAIFEQRVAYADQFFTSSQRPGHQTDRGRIHMRFGTPTEIVDRPVEATVGAYVIWNYSGLGQTFAFGDFRKDGDYRLIYSTHPNYPGDPTIQAQVDRDPISSRDSFLPGGRGYEKIIEDIKAYRVSTGFQP